jgi:hypothetical protein
MTLAIDLVSDAFHELFQDDRFVMPLVARSVKRVTLPFFAFALIVASSSEYFFNSAR